MVKFAKNLAKSRHGPWSDSYLNYKQLKKLIKKAKKEQSDKAAVAVQEIDKKGNGAKFNFRRRLETEIEQVTLFFLQKQGELAARLSVLRQTHADRYRKIIQDLTSSDATTSTGTEDANDFVAYSYITEIENMKQEYRHVGEELCILVQFVHLNVTGIRKILKKYDKYINDESLTQSFWEVEVMDSNFSHLPQLYHYEGIAAIVMTIQQALSGLKYFERMVQDHMMNPYVSLLTETAPEDITLAIAPYKQETGTDQDDPILIKIELYRRSLTHSNEFVKTMAKSSEFFFMEDSEDEISLRRPAGKRSSMSSFLNLASTFLYMTNYYIVAPTSAEYASKLGGNPAYAGLIIGMTPIATIFSTVVYSWWANYSYKSALVFASVCSLAGNIFYSLALSYKSLNMVLVGRLLNGFGGARAINRRFIADSFSRKERTAASADFVTAGALGMSAGPAFAAVFHYIKGGGTIWTEETAPGWVMGALWIVYIIAALLYFKEPPKSDPDVVKTALASPNNKKALGNEQISLLTNSSINSEEMTDFDRYGSIEIRKSIRDTISIEESSFDKRKEVFDKREEVKTKDSLLTNIPVMTTLTLYFVLKLVLESLFTSEPAITKYYFGWNASKAGTFLAVLGILIFPANLCLAKLSYKYDDRVIIGFITISMLVGIVGIVSYEDMIHINYNEFQYVFFGICIFISTNVLEGASMSLLSKTIPASYAKGTFNSGFLATEYGTLGRAVADIYISYIGVYGIESLLNNVFITLGGVTFVTTIIVGFTYPFLRLKKVKSDDDDDDDDSETYLSTKSGELSRCEI
mmetsp:Transcript_209/g.290  ORF Transcript_209/g.290 Transcript_209/m.290 type:complete len:806 (+) Transcript_209:206-2623(+)